MSKGVCGIGVKGNDYYTIINGKVCVEYRTWCNMIRRCVNSCYDTDQTYIGCTVSDNFKHYSFFYEWCQTQVGFKNTDENGRVWQLDKDLLIKGNKLYSEDTCVFVPQRINLLCGKRQNDRGIYPIGVYIWKQSAKNKFKAYCCVGKSKVKQLGYFNCPKEAFQAYKTFKEALVKEVANEYKDKLDPRAYQALMNYEVDIND